MSARPKTTFPPNQSKTKPRNKTRVDQYLQPRIKLSDDPESLGSLREEVIIKLLKDLSKKIDFCSDSEELQQLASAFHLIDLCRD